MTDKIVILTTAGSKDEARKIARALVERLLAACVNIVPQVASIYRWEGEIEEAEEWLLIIKTTQAALGRCARGDHWSCILTRCRSVSAFRSMTEAWDI